jgi:2-haloacid dehalogenase
LRLDAFADARAALLALKQRGLRIGILSNGTPRMLDAAAQASSIAPLCDAILSVDTVRMYKPRPEVYALVTDRFGMKPDEVAFVSSNRWDVMGAASFGFRPVWVNRSRMPEEYTHQPPVRTVSELAALPSLVL